MPDHGADIFEYRLFFGVVQRIFRLVIRVFFIDVCRTDEIDRQRAKRQENDIYVVISECQKHNDLQDIHRNVRNRHDVAFDIRALKRRKQNAFVREHEVTDHRIEQVNKIQKIQIDVRGGVALDEFRQKRRDCKPDD